MHRAWERKQVVQEEDPLPGHEWRPHCYVLEQAQVWNKRSEEGETNSRINYQEGDIGEDETQNLAYQKLKDYHHW